MRILQEIASYFCKGETGKSLIAVEKYRDGHREEFYSDKTLYGKYFNAESKIKVLADDGTASASECLIGCMLDYGAISYADICLIERGGVAKTYGKGIMQSTFPFGLWNTDAIKLTTAKIFWPKSGNCIHGRGILPADGAKTVKEDYRKDGEMLAAIAELFKA
jgi:C-terminal processing protease CtpA/Prc